MKQPPPYSPNHMRDRVEAVLHRTNHAIYEFANHLFQQVGGTFQQAVVLSFIHFNPGCNQKAVEKSLEVRGATVTVLLATMAAKGLIERQRNPRDARGVSLSLTPKGRKTLLRCREVFETLGEVLGKGISHDELENLTDVLQRMTDNCRQAEDLGLLTSFTENKE